MKIKRIEMHSFRGIGDMSLEFQEGEPNIVIGINGVGKSSILECIAILLSRYTKPIQFPTTSGRLFQEEDISTGSEETRNEITVSTSKGEVTWCLSKMRKKRSKTAGSDLSELRQLIDETHENLKINPVFNLPVIVHYGVNRAVTDIPLRVRKKHSLDRVSAYEQALDSVQINFNSFFQWFRKLEDLENEQRLDDSSFLNHQLEAVRQAISSLITGLTSLRIRRSPLRMTVKKQGKELNVHQLSDGEKCLLALVGDLARRVAISKPGLEDPFFGEGIVLIDEIELHLHPRWQRDIIPALKRTFPNCQFIVTTHSPQVISHVHPEGVFILERDEEQGLIIMSPEGSYGRDTNSILEDLMEVPERPQKIKDRLQELFRFIDDGNLAGAKELREELAAEIGDDEPEFFRADVLIRRKEILNK